MNNVTTDLGLATEDGHFCISGLLWWNILDVLQELYLVSLYVKTAKYRERHTERHLPPPEYWACIDRLVGEDSKCAFCNTLHWRITISQWFFSTSTGPNRTQNSGKSLDNVMLVNRYPFQISCSSKKICWIVYIVACQVHPALVKWSRVTRFYVNVSRLVHLSVSSRIMETGPTIFFCAPPRPSHHS